MTPSGPQCELNVRVTPRSSANKLTVDPDGGIRMWLTASPTDGQANEAACKLLADRLGVPRRSTSLAAGPKARRKRIHVDGLDAAEAMRRLAENRSL